MNENETLEHRLTEVEARSKSNQHRIDELEKEQGGIRALAESMARMDERMKTTEADVKEVAADVKSLLKVPGERNEKLWGYVVAAVASGILGYLVQSIVGG